MELTAIIEALLIASEKALSTEELARLVRSRLNEIEEESHLPEQLVPLASTSNSKIVHAITRLNQTYQQQQRAFSILERAQGWKIYTNPEYAEFVRQLFPEQQNQRLSRSAMETLAIVAYRQPITKAAMEAVRGVSCDGMIQKLLDRGLISIQGRADLPGRPLLYQTTALFFECFGIKGIEELPNASELRAIRLPDPEAEALSAVQETLNLKSSGQNSNQQPTN